MLGRPVTFNDSTGHIDFSVTKNINPICQYKNEFPMQQPTAIVVNPHTSRVSNSNIILMKMFKKNLRLS